MMLLEVGRHMIVNVGTFGPWVSLRTLMEWR